jgi:hypothetical protein
MTTCDITTLGDTTTSTPEDLQATVDGQREQIVRQSTTIADLNATVDDTARQLATATERHTLAVRQHRSDIAAIGERLLAEADDRGWCDAYDTVVADLNKLLTVALPTRERDHDVEIEIRVTVRVSAFGEQDAVEKANAVIRQIEREIDLRSGCTAYPEDSEDWSIQQV